jgi:hypothetical protein
MSYEPGLVGVNNTQDSKLSNILIDNIIQFYDWGFLDKGGYNNVYIPTSGMYGGSKHLLKPANDPNYAPNQSWQGFKNNWVWETGVSRTTQPVQISGIYRGNTFLPFSYNSSSGYYVGSGYRIDYPNGRVIFNTPIPATSVVSLNYSYKWATVQKSEGIPFFRQIEQSNFRIDQFPSSSGDWIQLGQNRVSLPAIFIENPKKRSYAPYQLGGGQWANTDILMYVISDKLEICTDILDMISYQNDRIIHMFNTNTVSRSGDLPINYAGDLKNKSNSYTKLLQNHYYNNCRIYNTVINDPVEISYSTYVGTVRFSTEIQLAGVT